MLLLMMMKMMMWKMMMMMMMMAMVCCSKTVDFRRQRELLWLRVLLVPQILVHAQSRNVVDQRESR